MIASLAMTAAFLFFGYAGIRLLLPRRRPLDRIWLGLSLGLLEEMWLPALFAFVFSFNKAAHLMALGAASLLTLCCWWGRDRRDAVGWDQKEKTLLIQILAVAVPLTVIGGYLQYTHTMRVNEDGAWHVGQSTYGDLPMHLSFITYAVGKRFPIDYPFFPGVRLSYPFLADTLSSTFCLFGSSLQAALIIPGTLMMALCYVGVLVLAREMTVGKKAVILAALLFFLNGGLGFLYDYDLAGGYGTGGEPMVFERTDAILNGYYKTPTNQPTPHNLRWSNVICDMMVPQRTLLGGWCMAIPCFYLLWTVFFPGRHERDGGVRGEILLGIWAGALPLIHTHSFLALGLSSIGVMAFDLIRGDRIIGSGIGKDLNGIPLPTHGAPRPRWEVFSRYVLYGVIAALLAVPQLFAFTFRQTFQNGEGPEFLRLHFNWVNNPEGDGLWDLYLWFYIKNIGLPFIALLLALFEKDPREKRIFFLALPVILAAELVLFQPNAYDNNKLFYLAWLMCCMIVADWVRKIWRRLKDMQGRYALAVLAGIVVFLSAGLTVWRECVSDYQAFGEGSVEAGTFVKDHTEEDAVFLTGRQHLNPVSSIAGRATVCGPDLWLYYHGFDTDERDEDITRFFADPGRNADVLEKYGVDYVYVSSYEKHDYLIDTEALDDFFPVVFRNGEATVYKVPEG